jgi:hypothetical protein
MGYDWAMKSGYAMNWVAAGILVFLAGCKGSDTPVSDGDWSKMQPITPRGYVCYRASGPIVVDGRGNEPAWAPVPWTERFMDIEGDRKPAPRFATRAKMLWDDEYLYVLAELEEPHVWGMITKKNEVIFYDNDFEVFIDPDGDHLNYYEYEMNALNTIWELTLVKPYRDGGPAILGTNLEGLKSAVYVNGTLNDPKDTDKGWSVEIAFPWKALKRYAGSSHAPPKDGEQWRMNFSRVEWLVDIIDGKYRKVPKEMRPEDNWVWSPQGVVDMHRPERWGYVQFSTQASEELVADPTRGVRDRLMAVYYRQKEYFKAKGKYAASMQELGMKGEGIRLERTKEGYTASVSMDGGEQVHVREDSRVWEDAQRR